MPVYAHLGDAIASYLQHLTDACNHYEKVAPTVCDHCDDLLRRIEGQSGKVSLFELCRVDLLWSNGEFMHSNLAANLIYKLRHELGMDTTGHIGF